MPSAARMMGSMPTQNTPETASPGGAASPALELTGVSVGEMRDVNLCISAGEVMALSGASGSGKSRLLRAIADLDAHGGDIRLGGIAQSAMAAHRWRQQVMLVPADSQWWADTVGEHFPGDREIEWEALGFSPAVANWEIARLSSGERQRLALLRAISHAPRAVLLDEPTANLDAETTIRVEQWLLSKIRERGCPAVWVSHDPAQIQRVARHHLKIRDHRLEAIE